MRTLVVFFAAMMLFVQQGRAQVQLQVQQWTENFDTLSSLTFTGIPSSQWKINTVYNVSPPNSYRGMVPNMMGDSLVLTTGVYNLTDLDYVTLRFRHICKVSSSDAVRMEYRITGYGWRPVPEWAYKGSARNFSRGFSAASYPEWQQSDSTAMPNQSWWKEEVFDLGGDVGLDPGVQFRFILKRGNVDGTQVSYGWLIDDFELRAANYEINDPIVEFLSPLVKDTVYSVGPWTINARVKTTTRARIENPKLIYTAENSQGTFTDSILMTKTSIGDSLWKATIPQFVVGTKVTYSITGRDTTGNEVTIHSWYYITRAEIEGGGGTTTGYVIVGVPIGTLH